MAIRIGHAPGTPYHLLAKTAAYRWWKPLLALVLVSVVFVLGQGLGLVLQVMFDLPEGSLPWGMLPLVAGLAVIVVPGVMLIARVVDRRPGGTVSSVLGRIRLPWLGWCFLIAAPMFVAIILIRGDTLDLSSDTPLKLAPVLVYLPFIVFQAAGEEYVFRGLLVQSFAAWFRTPWIGALISTALFGLAHDYSDPMIIAEFVVFSLTMVWITLHRRSRSRRRLPLHQQPARPLRRADERRSHRAGRRPDHATRNDRDHRRSPRIRRAHHLARRTQGHHSNGCTRHRPGIAAVFQSPSHRRRARRMLGAFR